MMESLDINGVLMLLERGAHPRATLDALLQASRQLRLPVSVDRRLYELTKRDLDAHEVVRELTAFVHRLRGD